VDEGVAQLEQGSATVRLDPVFRQTIEDRDYIVHLTPYRERFIYVAETGPGYFVVRGTAGGPDITFAWRLSAVRKGYQGIRLEEVKKP